MVKTKNIKCDWKRAESKYLFWRTGWWLGSQGGREEVREVREGEMKWGMNSGLCDTVDYTNASLLP